MHYDLSQTDEGNYLLKLDLVDYIIRIHRETVALPILAVLGSFLWGIIFGFGVQDLVLTLAFLSVAAIAALIKFLLHSKNLVRYVKFSPHNKKLTWKRLFSPNSPSMTLSSNNALEFFVGDELAFLRIYEQGANEDLLKIVVNEKSIQYLSEVAMFGLRIESSGIKSNSNYVGWELHRQHVEKYPFRK